MTAVLLIGSGLLLNSLAKLQAVDAGFERSDRTLVPVALPPTRYPDLQSVELFQRQLLTETVALPGVEAAGLGQFIPLTGASNWGFVVEGGDPEDVGFADYTLIAPGYLETMGQRIVQGRDFDWQDTDESAPPVMLVSQAMAENTWPVASSASWVSSSRKAGRPDLTTSLNLTNASLMYSSAF